MTDVNHMPDSAVETETMRIVREAAHTSLKIGFPVRLIGRPGTGKTCALWHVARELKGTYCEITAASKNVKGMFEGLLRAIDYASGKNHVSMIADMVYRLYAPVENFCEDLGTWGPVSRLLVIDEIQTLEAQAFRELLRVQERCQLGLVVAGNEERLAGSKKDAETLAQIESRILPRRHLSGPSRCDCELIGASYNVEGKAAYDFIAAFGMATNFRALIQLLEVAQRLNGGTRGICQQHLEAGLRFLNPTPETLKLMKSQAV